MLDRVLKTIRSHSLFTYGDTVIVAVSGGADSVALLDLLHRMKEFRLNLVAAHLNHCLRGSESDDDEHFVRELCDSMGIQCEFKRVDVKKLAGEKRLSLEDAGRAARYGFFHELRDKHSAQVIALGHHADDQAETVLMRLLRGAGATGLAGMTPKSHNGIVRPLLEVTRRDIEAYLNSRRLTWRTDSSNMDTDFLRNRIRHELLPFLETFNPSIKSSLVVTAGTVAADEEILEAATEAGFSRCGTHADGATIFSLRALDLEPPGIRLRLYRLAIRHVHGTLARIGFRHLQAIDLLRGSERPNSSLDLPDGMRISRSYDTLKFAVGGAEQKTVPYEFTVDGPGDYCLPDGRRLLVREATFPDTAAAKLPVVAWFDRQSVPFPWLVRTFRAGDRIVPRGMTGSRKVKDIFIDAKIPLEIRGRVPLIFSGGHLVWIGGMKVSARTGVTENTASILKVEILDPSPWIDL